MKLPKIKKLSPIEIIWSDAISTSGGWKSDEDYEDFKNTGIEWKQIGYFIEVKDKKVYIMSGHSYSRDGIGHRNFIFAVPTGCIKSIKKL